MTINEKRVTVGELTEGYVNNDEQGVRGYGGRLDIRPPYQREFIYDDSKQQAVIRTVMHGYPLNVMYWVRRADDADCPYEVMDGQQRTLSLCEYVAGKFCFEEKFFFNQPANIQKRILDYPLTVYVCQGEPSEKLEWFKTINIAGEPLKDQEMRNAVYAGPFVSDAKRHFSKTGCGAYRLAKDLISGSPIRQDFLQRAIGWMSAHETRSGHSQTIEGYMAQHQHDPNAGPLWAYFQSVCNWALTNFDVRKFRRIMKDLDWAQYYDQFSSRALDTATLAKRMHRLMIDSEVQHKQGIIPYVLTGDESKLDLRAFADDIKLAVYEEQGQRCAICGKKFAYEQMEGDHITPWSKGGRTVKENCQMLCKSCNRRKSNK